MRIDKFLKVSRIIKRRAVAKEICDAGHVKINGRVAKSSSEIKIGDELEIFDRNVYKTYKVLELKEFANEEDAKKMYLEEET